LVPFVRPGRHPSAASSGSEPREGVGRGLKQGHFRGERKDQRQLPGEMGER
jgi:hypothetical protein